MIHDTNQKIPTQKRGRHKPRRGAALFAAVMATALLVSMIGLAALTLVRVEREDSSIGSERMLARSNARSAVELALRVLANDSNWRTTYASGTETTPLAVGDPELGLVSWNITDTDGSLLDTDTELCVMGFGRVGNTIQITSLAVESVADSQLLRSQSDATNVSDGELTDTEWWCQYLKVTLPAGATGWRVTHIELYAERQTGNSDFEVRLYAPLPSNMPSTTQLDAVSLNSNAFSETLDWKTVTFSGDYWMAPTDGVCIALETTAITPPIRLRYTNGGLSEADSALITGNPTWNTYETGQALHYRVYGEYQAFNGLPQPIMGTWRWEAEP